MKKLLSQVLIIGGLLLILLSYECKKSINANKINISTPKQANLPPAIPNVGPRDSDYISLEEAQSQVDFKILQPNYLPKGYKFRGAIIQPNPWGHYVTLFYDPDANVKAEEGRPDLVVSMDEGRNNGQKWDVEDEIKRRNRPLKAGDTPSVNEKGDIVYDFITNVNGLEAIGSEKSHSNFRGKTLKFPAKTIWPLDIGNNKLLVMRVGSYSLSFEEVKKIAESLNKLDLSF